MPDRDRLERDEELDGDVGIDTEDETDLHRPRLFKVLLHNDDYTTMEFVVHILMDIFHHPENVALRIMLQVHQDGIGVAGVFPFEVAETKVAQATDRARENEFPLRCSLEPA